MIGPRYIEDQKAWLLPECQDCEVIVGGDGTAPNAVRLALAKGAIRSLPELRERAAAYLEEFVDRRKFAAASEWHLEGVDCGLASRAADQFSLSFSLEGDIYGRWSVTLQLADGSYFPIGFERVQI